MNKPQFLISGDPEVMLCDENGEVQSSIPILRHDKHSPIILDKKTGTQIFSDNVLCEFSFDPSGSKKELIDKYHAALQKIQQHIGKKYRILAKSAHVYKDEDLNESFGVNPKEIGCSPSFCFRRREIKQLNFEDASSPNMRSGSAHLHLSSPILKTLEDKETILHLIEAHVGLASVIWDKDETSIERRKVYGKSGEMRLPQGEGRVEARFMSNYILRSPALIDLAYDLVEYCFSLMYDGKAKEVLKSVNGEMVEKAINECDCEVAKSVLKDIGIPKNLFKRIMAYEKVNFSAASLYKNWKIKV